MRRLLSAVPSRDPLALTPEVDAPVDLAAEYAHPAEGGWLRANFVTSADGAIRGPDGLSGSISGPADKRIFGVLRRLADCVLVGAETARAEGYRPARLPIAVVSGSLHLDLSLPLFAEAEHRTLVLTSAAAPPDLVRAVAEHAEVIVCGDERVDPTLAVAALAERGHRRLLCEGGPSLLAQLLASGVLDELCLTTSPTLAGDGPHLFPQPLDALARLELAGLLEDDGFLFHRYLVRR